MPRTPSNKTNPRPGRTTVIISASVDPEVKRMALRNAERRGFKNSLSAYVAKLIEDDVEREENPHPHTKFAYNYPGDANNSAGPKSEIRSRGDSSGKANRGDLRPGSRAQKGTRGA